MAEDSLDSLKKKYIIIGGSAGSLEVLLQILPALNPKLNAAIIIILHRKNTYDSALSALFSSKTTLKVKEAEEKETIKPGTIYIAPADYHLLIEKDNTFSMDYSEKVNYSRPSIDVTFTCAGEVFGSQVAAILLSGANSDGVEGLKEIMENGGIIAAQDPETAEVSYMPQQAINTLKIDYVLKTEEIAGFINSLVS